MNVLHILALAVLAAAIVLSLVVAARTGEARVGLLVALFALLGVQHAFSLWSHWGEPLAFDLASAGASAGLAAGLLGLVSALVIYRTLQDLDRAEALHWDSMEAVRGLTELAARRDTPLEERLPALLAAGCAHLGLDVGLVSRVRGQRYEVVAIHAPAEFPIGAGAIFSLDETYCGPTLAADRAVAVSRAVDASWAEHPARTAFRFETYLAAAIRTADEPSGTLVFASVGPRRERLSATHKDLALLMAQWIGWEQEREELERERAARAEKPTAPRIRRHGPRPAGLRLDTLLRRCEKRIRRIVPAGIEVEFPRAPELPPAREPRLPLESILLSLVRRAADAMPGTGTLRVATETQEPPASEPGVMPAVAPARYVTVTVSESSGGLDADALTRAFDAERPAGALGAEIDGGIPLSTIYRMLQRAGGDLSVEAEPGRGSRFTLFLPLADTPAEAADRPAEPAVPTQPRAPAGTAPA